MACGHQSAQELDSNCGASRVEATANGSTVALASCAGTIGVHPLPVVHAATGEQITVTYHGSAMGSLAVTTPGVVVIDGQKMKAVHAGSTTVESSGGPPCAASAKATQTTTCPLLLVVVK